MIGGVIDVTKSHPRQDFNLDDDKIALELRRWARFTVKVPRYLTKGELDQIRNKLL